MLAVILLLIFLAATIVGNVVLYSMWRNANEAAGKKKQIVSACDYEGCKASVFQPNDIYIGIGELPEIFMGINTTIKVPMAIKILSQNPNTKKDGSSYYEGSISIHKHDGAPSNEYYYTYGGCTEYYFYDPVTCKFSYTKSRCLTDKELAPAEKQKIGNQANCCSGTCPGKHSGANTVIRNIEYKSNSDTFEMTLYNNDNKKSTTFPLANIGKTWPKTLPGTKIVLATRDTQIFDDGCTWSNTSGSGKCVCK